MGVIPYELLVHQERAKHNRKHPELIRPEIKQEPDRLQMGYKRQAERRGEADRPGETKRRSEEKALILAAILLKSWRSR